MPLRALDKGAVRQFLDPRQLVPAKPSLHWELAVPGGLRPWPGATVWQSGHVTAVVPWGKDELLVGTHSGGVWHLQPDASGSVSATPLSNDWDNPDVFSMCLAGDAPDHVYAGCFVRPLTDVVLYESMPRSAGSVWQPVPIDPLGSGAFGHVYAIGVSQGRLVCATSKGLWWSPLPAVDAPAGARTYRWESVIWPAGQDPGGISGLALGPDGAPAVSSLAGGTFWTGRWNEQRAVGLGGPTLVVHLRMSAASAPAVTGAARSSLAGSPTNPSRMYAVVGHDDSTPDNQKQTIAAVLTSTDAGRSWTTVNGSIAESGGTAVNPPLALVENLDQSGGQVDWNNCIAVSPHDEGTVAIGWQRAFFVSTNATATDGSASWNRVADVNVAGVHKDVHVLWFDSRAGGRLYVGSDGGLLSSDDLGATVNTEYNRRIADLQFESTPEREFYGLTSANPAVAGVIGGGLQDNGVVWASLGGHWEEVLGGDGAGTVFLADGSLLAATLGAEGDAAHLWRWDGNGYTDKSIPPRLGPFGPERPTDPAGLRDPALAAVPTPSFQRNSRTLWAVGGNGQEPNVVWGLFRNADGSEPMWERVCTLPADMSLWAFSTVDGTVLFAAGYRTPSSGRIAALFRIDTATGSFAALPDPLTLVDGVSDRNDGPALLRLCMHPDGSLLAVYGTNAGGQLLKLDATHTTWTRLSGSGGLPKDRAFGVDVDQYGTLYATTDASVLTSPDGGATWWNVSAGLPRRAHLGQVVFVRYAGGGVGLYLSTFGRSVWKARWPATPLPPSASRPAWGWNNLVGSLTDGHLWQFGPNGWNPIGPGPGDPALLQRGAQEFGALIQAANDLVAASVPGPAGQEAGPAAAPIQALIDGVAQAAAVLVLRAGMRQAGGSLSQASSAIENGARALAAFAASAQLDARLKPHLAEASSALLAHAGALTQISRGVSGP